MYHPCSSSRRSSHQYSQETPVVTSQEKKEKEPKKQKCRQRSSKRLESQLNPSNVNVGCSNVCESNLHMKDTTPNEEYAVVSTSDREKVSATPSSPKKVRTYMSSTRLHFVTQMYKMYVVEPVWPVLAVVLLLFCC